MKTKTAIKRQGIAPQRRKHVSNAAPSLVVTPPEVRTIDPKWAWHYRTLLALREKLLRETDEKLRAAAEPIELHGAHPADSGTDEFEHDVALALLAREQNALSDVTHAITRILEGRYGICEATGVKIAAKRLRALPWCRYSLEAGQRIERGAKNVKCRVPDAVSLRGQKRDLPDTGTTTRGDSEGPAEEVKERDEVKNVADEATASPGNREEPLAGDRPAERFET
jgi:RNA polymerase-binding transcription factor DksA